MKKINKLFYLIEFTDTFYEVWVSRWVVRKFLGFKYVKQLGYDVSAFDNKQEAVMHLRISKAGYVRYIQTHK